MSEYTENCQAVEALDYYVNRAWIVRKDRVKLNGMTQKELEARYAEGLDHANYIKADMVKQGYYLELDVLNNLDVYFNSFRVGMPQQILEPSDRCMKCKNMIKGMVYMLNLSDAVKLERKARKNLKLWDDKYASLLGEDDPTWHETPEKHLQVYKD